MLLFGMVVIAFGAWLYGRWQLEHPLRATVAAFAMLLFGMFVAWPGASLERAAPAAAISSSAGVWVPYSKQQVAALRAEGRAVFIDFTATWCITCQVNKRIALNDSAVQAKFESLNVVRMKADWTLKDPTITEALSEFGRNGVPLYVYYPARGEPRILPEVLTPGIVIAALTESAAIISTK
jgi:thiol:disulfide interchange protein DsbD